MMIIKITTPKLKPVFWKENNTPVFRTLSNDPRHLETLCFYLLCVPRYELGPNYRNTANSNQTSSKISNLFDLYIGGQYSGASHLFTMHANIELPRDNSRVCLIKGGSKHSDSHLPIAKAEKHRKYSRFDETSPTGPLAKWNMGVYISASSKERTRYNHNAWNQRCRLGSSRYGEGIFCIPWMTGGNSTVAKESVEV